MTSRPFRGASGNPPSVPPFSKGGRNLGIAVVLLVHLTLLWLYYQPSAKVLAGDEDAYLQAATRLLDGQPSGLDLLWPPLYPAFLALLLALGGGSLLVVQAVQTLMLVAVALLLRDLWIRFEGRGPAADVLALALLAYPPLAAFAHYLWPEVLHLTLFVAALWILASRRRQAPWLAALGLVLGLALLTKSLLGPFLPVLLLPLFLEDGWRARIRRAALVVAVLAATIAPALIANHARHGVWVIADSSRFNLWVGLNDRGRRNLDAPFVIREYALYQKSAEDHRERNRLLDAKIRALVRERGWPRVLGDQLSRQYFRLFDKDSFLTDQLPGGAFTERRRGYLGASRPLAAAVRWTSYGIYALILVGAAFGLALTSPRSRPWAWTVLAFLAYNLAIFLLLHVKTRYRVQFLPFLVVYACRALDVLWTKTRAAVPWTRAAAGALGAVLLLFLAFGGSVLD
jgi:4-amino-4-deoxy-L-arabinose transferase-like glycosyltransferase